MRTELSQALRDRADLMQAWGEYELGQEKPAPLDYEDTACKLLNAAEEIERLESLLGNSELAVAELIDEIKSRTV